MSHSLVLFAHVVGVLLLFVGLAVEWISVDAVTRSATRAEALTWVRTSAAVPRITGIAMIAILASGFYLGARFGVLGEVWMRVSYAAILVMAVVGGPVAGPALRALRRAGERSDEGAVDALRAAAASTRLRLSLRVRIVFGLAVVYLMVGKPDAGQSLFVLGVAVAAAIAVGAWKPGATSRMGAEVAARRGLARLD